MSVTDVVVRHVPEVRHLAGIIPDDELCARAFERLEDSTRSDVLDETYSQTDYDDACEDAADDAREEIKNDVLHILDNVEWSTADELAKLIREAIE